MSSGPPEYAEAVRLATACVPGFHIADGDGAHFAVDRLTLGTTNHLLRVKPTFVGPLNEVLPTVVVRLFGEGTELMICRESEVALQSLFLQTYGKFPHALVYEFLDGMVEAHCDAFKTDAFVGRFTRLVAAFHSGILWGSRVSKSRDAAGAASLLTMSFGVLNRTLTVESVYDSNRMPGHPMPPLGSSAPTFVETCLQRWVALVGDQDAVAASLRTEEERTLFRSMQMTPVTLAAEVAYINKVIAANADFIPLAICHNDLNCFNILLSKEHIPTPSNSLDADADLFSSMRPIDFEYSGWGHIYFDIGNHLNEFAGVDVSSDFERTFPGDEFIEAWLRRYFSALDGYLTRILMRSGTEEGSSDSNRRSGGSAERITWLHLPSESAIPRTDEGFARAVRLTKFFSLVSHFLWSVWSVLQAPRSKVDFGFVTYASLRWSRYLACKAAFSEGL